MILLLQSCCDVQVCVCQVVLLYTAVAPLAGRLFCVLRQELHAYARLCVFKLVTDIFSIVISDWQLVCLQIVYTFLYLKSTCRIISNYALNETLPVPYHFRFCIDNSSSKPTPSWLRKSQIAFPKQTLQVLLGGFGRLAIPTRSLMVPYCFTPLYPRPPGGNSRSPVGVAAVFLVPKGLYLSNW